ncbi:MAG: hypothetical protein ACI865_002858, partial [Flavobacteriaceae bacterium]
GSHFGSLFVLARWDENLFEPERSGAHQTFTIVKRFDNPPLSA